MQRIRPVWGDDQEPDVEDAFGEHDIEYWVWRGNQLVPATSEQAALLSEREALARLACMRHTGALALGQAHRPPRGVRMLRLFHAAALRSAVALTVRLHRLHRLLRLLGGRLAATHGADRTDAPASSKTPPLR